MRLVVDECKGEEWELPHDAVEGCNAQKVPLRGHPAPKLILRERVLFKAVHRTHESWTVDFPSTFGVYEEVYQSWDEGASVASKEIFPLLSPHAL